MKIPKNWTFQSKEVADNFDDHVVEQLPWYELITSATESIVRQYLPVGGVIYDVGCATGNINRALNDLIMERNARYTGIDNSKEMIKNFNGKGEVILSDALSFDYKSFDICICFLTILFLPFSDHELFIKKLVGKIKKGGCLIIVDKFTPGNGYVSTVFSRLVLKEKLKKTSADEILTKELSLSGIQRPLNKKYIKDIGVEFFRFCDFSGYIIENN